MKRVLYILIFLLALVVCDRGIALVLNKGLERYFGFDKPADVLLVGHSHLMLALDKELLERELNITVAKYCREGVNVSDRKQMVKHFLSLSESKPPRMVIYGVDPFMFTGKGLSANSYKLFYPFMDEAVMDAYIKAEAESAWDYWGHKLFHVTRYSDALINSSIRGWLGNWENFKRGQVTKEVIESAGKRDIALEQELIDDFTETIRLLTNSGIQVLLLNTPVVDTIREQNLQKWEGVESVLQGIAQSSDLVEYRDYNSLFSKNYSLFYDAIHLNQEGQMKVTEHFIREKKGEMHD